MRPASKRPGSSSILPATPLRPWPYLDALKIFDGPKIELHISNVHKREEIYHKSLVSRAATAVMAGFGAYGYRLALRAMADMTQ